MDTRVFFRYKCEQNGNRVIIYRRNCIASTLVELEEVDESVWIQIILKKSSILLGTVSRSPSRGGDFMQLMGILL